MFFFVDLINDGFPLDQNITASDIKVLFQATVNPSLLYNQCFKRIFYL